MNILNYMDMLNMIKCVIFNGRKGDAMAIFGYWGGSQIIKYIYTVNFL